MDLEHEFKMSVYKNDIPELKLGAMTAGDNHIKSFLSNSPFDKVKIKQKQTLTSSSALQLSVQQCPITEDSTLFTPKHLLN